MYIYIYIYNHPPPPPFPLMRSFFPERCNVSVVTVSKDKKSIRMRVWERGTGITQACGTGACGTAVNAVRRGLIGKDQVWMGREPVFCQKSPSVYGKSHIF